MAVRELPFGPELHIRAVVADVRLASEWLAREAGGVPSEALGRLELCLNEALANVIAHGGDSAAAQSVALQVCVQQDMGEAAVSVTDAGPAFDATSAALKEPAHSLADATPGGLGLLLMRKLSDALAYHRADDKNVLTITVRWA